MELTELKDVDFNLRELAVNTVKYQNFRTTAAMDKFKTTFSPKTATNYFNLGIVYIKTKVRNRAVGKKFYNYIDEAIEQHVQPLTPSLEDKRRVFKKIFTKKEAKLPVQEALKEMKTDNLTEKFEYGVMYNDTIKVFGTDATKAKVFLAGIKFAGMNGKLVQITDLEK